MKLCHASGIGACLRVSKWLFCHVQSPEHQPHQLGLLELRHYVHFTAIMCQPNDGTAQADTTGNYTRPWLEANRGTQPHRVRVAECTRATRTRHLSGRAAAGCKKQRNQSLCRMLLRPNKGSARPWHGRMDTRIPSFYLASSHSTTSEYNHSNSSTHNSAHFYTGANGCNCCTQTAKRAPSSSGLTALGPSPCCRLEVPLLTHSSCSLFQSPKTKHCFICRVLLVSHLHTIAPSHSLPPSLPPSLPLHFPSIACLAAVSLRL